MNRQTDYTIDKLVKILGTCDCERNEFSVDTSQWHPRCFLVNEIGLTMMSDDKAGASEALTELLCHENYCVRISAYCFLKKTDGLAEEIIKKLVGFEDHPENKNLILDAKNRLLNK
ncbi:MAG: hypothetical protein H8E41_08025 [Desulfobulbaceae bacterium]|uniref:HEAT repeat domain-containing protein n=1 Tax=Candidatus Desulfobia pelagia TaxID=2841692 RepID=A0A8J6TCN8_9BACT|nr:hypothetical protein [Candidatus Desulfobia pelagia]